MPSLFHISHRKIVHESTLYSTSTQFSAPRARPTVQTFDRLTTLAASPKKVEFKPPGLGNARVQGHNNKIVKTSIPSLTTCLILSLFLLMAPKANALNIVIDPGHGGTDTGAVRGGVKESALVLNVAKQLKDLIDQDIQFRSILTRDKDKMMSLNERVQTAEKWGADIFISLHANTAPDARARGMEVFFQNSLPPDEDSQYLAGIENQNFSTLEESTTKMSRSSDVAVIVQDLHRQARMQNSLRLSEAVQNHVDSAGPVTIKQAPFFVISKSSMPSVLIELGFLSHPKELQKLTSEVYQKDLAKKIHSALVQYKEKMDSQEPQALK